MDIKHFGVVLYFFLYYSCFQVYGQESEGLNLPQIIPPSPDAKALGIYGQANVNYYNGTVDTSIPIYNIKIQDYTFPIYLSYNGGGIKVDQVASSVGMGWTLNAGGVITRIVRGIADEGGFRKWAWTDYNGNPLLTNPVFSTHPLNPALYLDNEAFIEYAQGGRDSQPDEFYFNFFGHSGRFLFDQHGNIIPMSSFNLKFESIGYREFIITDEQGVKYFFDTKETVTSITVSSQPNSGSVNSVCTSWFLSKITIPGNETISFQYDNYHIERYPVGRQEVLTTPSTEFGGITKYYNEIHQARKLRSITFSDGSIEFIPGKNRSDLPGDKFISSIVINNSFGTVKRYKFDYKYMYGNSGNHWKDMEASAQDPLITRLYLDTFSEIATDNSDDNKKIYRFTYHPGLPSRLSFSRDHWGFYNLNSELTDIPSTTFYAFGVKVRHKGAYKEPNLERTQCGSLKKIIYPTGGFQEFYYELNDCSNVEGLKSNFIIEHSSINSIIQTAKPFVLDSHKSVTIKLNGSGFNRDLPNKWPVVVKIKNRTGNDVFTSLSRSNTTETQLNLPPGTYTWVFEIVNRDVKLGYSGNYYEVVATYKDYTSSNIVKVGGLRVKSIRNYDSKNWQFREFKYLNDQGVSSGFLVSIPTYKPYIYAYSAESKVIVGSPNEDLMRKTMILNSTPSYILANTVAGPSGYSKVTECFSQLGGEPGKNGKIAYYFTNPELYRDDWSNIIDPYGDKTSVPYYGFGMQYPYCPPSSKEWKRGKLIKKVIYEKTEKIYVRIREIINEYDFILKDKIKALKVAITVSHNYPNKYFSSFFYNYYQIEAGLARLKSKIQTDYLNGDSVKTTTNYYYNKKDQVSRIAIIGDPKCTVVKENKYPYDLDDGTNVYHDMVIDNIISPVVSKKVSINGNWEESNTNYYRFSNNVIKPQNITSRSSLNRQEEVQICFNRYDEKGKLLEYTPKNEIKTSIIWGYSQTLPIAKAENVTYSVLEAAVTSSLPIGFNTLENLLKSENGIGDMTTQAQRNLWKEFNTNLRNQNALNKALLSTQTYDPLVGITSQTDPNGITTFYEYDAFGRLKLIMDHEGHVINKYKYHYKTTVRK